MRILVLSDIHANLVALETVLAAANGEYDAVWCLGDVIGYGPRPNECVELMRDRASVCVMGNHDWAVLGRPGINVDDFNPQARQAVLWTRRQLSDRNRSYLDSLPAEPVRPMGDTTFLVTHASPREPVWEYILTPNVAMENFAVFSESVCLVGHTHKPAIFRWRVYAEVVNGPMVHRPAKVDHLLPQRGVDLSIDTGPDERLIINPGSVGQPRDNDARAAYAILDTELLTWRYERVAYPIELTQGQMQEAGLPRRLIDRLSFGW